MTITLDDDLMAELDAWSAERGYQNRSEAIRDLTRAGLRQMSFGWASGQDCVAAVVYVYDHATRELSKRLVHAFHDHQDISVATMHVHLDHGSCMEVTVLKGRIAEVRHFADHVIAERGVRHGQVVLVPTEALSQAADEHPPKTDEQHADAAAGEFPLSAPAGRRGSG